MYSHCVFDSFRRILSQATLVGSSAPGCQYNVSALLLPVGLVMFGSSSWQGYCISFASTRIHNFHKDTNRIRQNDFSSLWRLLFSRPSHNQPNVLCGSPMKRSDRSYSEKGTKWPPADHMLAVKPIKWCEVLKANFYFTLETVIMNIGGGGGGFEPMPSGKRLGNTSISQCWLSDTNNHSRSHLQFRVTNNHSLMCMSLCYVVSKVDL